MKNILTLLFLTLSFLGYTQERIYTNANAHSHNDYNNNIPFYRAYHQNFGSIEADIFPLKGELFIAHNKEDININKTFAKLYLNPIIDELNKSPERKLRLLIDIKENHLEALPLLIKLLQPLKSLLSTTVAEKQLSIVISGNRPIPSDFKKYPDYIFFDYDLSSNLSADQAKRVGLISVPFTRFSKWNGLGVLTTADKQRVKGVIDSVHQLRKQIRFWAAPDTKTAWITQMNLGVDVIGTDRIEELGVLLKNLSKSNYRQKGTTQIYKPSYRSDGKSGKVKNIIFLIGDGMGLAHSYSAYTANHGKLNLFQMQNIGLSVTTAANAYGTDSAAGATAMATGEKTNNRHIGTDTSGKPLKSIMSFASEAGKKTAIIVSELITGATPSAFYAHQTERDESVAIANDLPEAGIDIIVGSGKNIMHSSFKGTSSYEKLQVKGYKYINTMDELLQSDADKIVAILDDSITRTVLNGRGNYLSSVFKKVTTILKKNPKGFFMMLEGSKIDGGGHSNNLPMLITESLDFDQVVGEALRFADEDGETLVVVTADHECGGLTLLDGNIEKGKVTAEFSTNDHTGIPVPVYAYGVHADEFRGIYQNTDLFKKMLSLLQSAN